MLLTPGFPAGLQRARRPLPGFGAGRLGNVLEPKRLFPSHAAAGDARKKKKGFLGIPQHPAGRTLHPWFSELLKKFGMTHTQTLGEPPRVAKRPEETLMKGFTTQDENAVFRRVTGVTHTNVTTLDTRE